MKNKRLAFVAGVGCIFSILLLIMLIAVGCVAIEQLGQTMEPGRNPLANPPAEAPAGQQSVPALEPENQSPPPPQLLPGGEAVSLTDLYQQITPGVVSIRVQIAGGILGGGQGAGSGFILDNEGHIVTNNHVVADAERIVVIFYNGYEVEARVVGTDADSDLAVIVVDEFADGAHPLPLGDSDLVRPGEWVVAIGNPFGQQSSMTVGIVSAVGRTIPSIVTPFSIPQAIQTDAAINPGNSGGPLLNLNGEVIGVNAQIRTEGVRANAGVGFAIPSNVVALVAPELIREGRYEWPWLGVRGGDVNLAVMEANNLEMQRGAYIVQVEPDGPAAKAGLRGAPNPEQPEVGGDIIIAVDGQPIADFTDLLVKVAFSKPGDQLELTILRDGRRQTVTVTLDPRPKNLNP